jgi:16S rRNA (guanine527-N7)-methyltransferase
MKTIKKYFPDLSDNQYTLLESLGELLKESNHKVNIISRKDIQNVYEHHILHSLTILKWYDFKPSTSILDLGTGGGLPGLPLAILRPECIFHLIDARRKKIDIVQEMVQQLNLKNVEATHVRAEETINRYQFVISRAVTNLPDLWKLSQKLINDRIQKNSYPNGLICLKGGDISKEIKNLPKGSYYETHKITSKFKEPFFEDKYVVYVQK